MLKLENSSFRYHQDLPWIFKNVHVTLNAAEIVGISGASGSGKTTLAKILAGYIRPQTGNLSIDNNPLPGKGYCPVQLVFQHPESALNPRWKIKKILREVEGFIPPEDLLHELSIHPLWLDRFPHELSGGELQRIAVARILNQKTRFIIADEMTSMLDTITQAQIWNAVIKFSKVNNAGMLVISHDEDLLNRICTRRVSIHKLVSS